MKLRNASREQFMLVDSDHTRTLDELYEALAPLVGSDNVEVTDRSLRVLVTEGEFTLMPTTSEDGVPCLEWTVVAREAPPGLGTWWTQWRSTSDDVEAIIEEFRTSRTAIRRMLRERFGTSADATT
jgi:hypothetical protein